MQFCWLATGVTTGCRLHGRRQVLPRVCRRFGLSHPVCRGTDFHPSKAQLADFNIVNDPGTA
jgi:hypothetical protein